jgi:1,4-alpha-glucan branching enzyme
MGEEVKSDLPKIKGAVKVKGAATTSAEKPAKAKTEKKPVKAKAAAKTDKKAEKPKKEKAPSTKAAKPAKADKGGKKVASTKTAAKSKAPAKGGAVTPDAIAERINKMVASGKAEPVKTVDYASGKSVAEGLVAKASTILLKTYSDKAVSSITHGDNEIAKAAKEMLAKNAASVRAGAVAKHSKKMAGAIVKAVKAADAGKLTATDYRAVTLEV